MGEGRGVIGAYGQSRGTARVAQVRGLSGTLALVPLQGFQLGELLALADQVVDGDESIDPGAGDLEDEDLVAGDARGVGGL